VTPARGVNALGSPDLLAGMMSGGMTQRQAISPASPLYLPRISPVSPRISPASTLYLSCISSQPSPEPSPEPRRQAALAKMAGEQEVKAERASERRASCAQKSFSSVRWGEM